MDCKVNTFLQINKINKRDGKTLLIIVIIGNASLTTKLATSS